MCVLILLYFLCHVARVQCSRCCVVIVYTDCRRHHRRTRLWCSAASHVVVHTMCFFRPPTGKKLLRTNENKNDAVSRVYGMRLYTGCSENIRRVQRSDIFVQSYMSNCIQC